MLGLVLAEVLRRTGSDCRVDARVVSWITFGFMTRVLRKANHEFAAELGALCNISCGLRYGKTAALPGVSCYHTFLVRRGLIHISVNLYQSTTLWYTVDHSVTKSSSADLPPDNPVVSAHLPPDHRAVSKSAS